MYWQTLKTACVRQSLVVTETDITDFEQRFNLPGIGRKALEAGIWVLDSSDALSGAGNARDNGNITPS